MNVLFDLCAGWMKKWRFKITESTRIMPYKRRDYGVLFSDFDASLRKIKKMELALTEKMYQLLNDDEEYWHVREKYAALVFFDGMIKPPIQLNRILRIFMKFLKGGQLSCNTLLEKGLIIPVKFFSENLKPRVLWKLTLATLRMKLKAFVEFKVFLWFQRYCKGTLA